MYVSLTYFLVLCISNYLILVIFLIILKYIVTDGVREEACSAVVEEQFLSSLPFKIHEDN